MRPQDFHPASKPVELTPAAAKSLAQTLLDFDSYAWNRQPWAPQYRVRYTFVTGTTSIEVFITDDHECLQVITNGHQTPDLCCRPGKHHLLDVTKGVFHSAKFNSGG